MRFSSRPPGSAALASRWGRRVGVVLLAGGCAHRGMRVPGPLDGLGGEPPPYAESLAAEDEAVLPAGPSGEAPPEDRARKRRKREGDPRVARAAAAFVGHRRLVVDGTRYRYDCSGLVEAAYARAGIPVRGSSAGLYALARDAGVLHRRRRPAPGDVAFFDDTYDRNGDGRRNDELSHVAIVESVDADGTITLVHKGSRGVTRIVMNLERPHDHADEDGRVINSYLRATSDRDGGPTLSGELWRAFGSLWAVDEEAVAAR